MYKAKTYVGRKHKMHGLRKHPLYKRWINIKTRCYNENRSDYKYYGGKGIIMCDEWKNDFMSFYDWSMENGYFDELTIDRIDVNGNYDPDNCRWVDTKTQLNNMSSNKNIEYDGKTQTISEWSEELNMKYSSLYGRLESHKWDIERALTEELYSAHKKYYYNGEYHTLPELAVISDIGYKALYLRICKKGMTVEDAIQCGKKMNVRLIDVDGEMLSISQISKEYNIPEGTVRRRLNNGWSVYKTINTPIKNTMLYEYNNERLTLNELSAKYNINRNLLKDRIYRGMPIEEAIEKPVRKARTYIDMDGEELTVAQLSKKYGINRTTLNTRLNRMGLSLEDAINFSQIKT